MKKLVASAVLSLCLGGITAAPAFAESPKTCENTDPYKQGWTQQSVNEQTAACESSSDNKHETVPVVVSNTNPGGQLPPGQQP